MLGGEAVLRVEPENQNNTLSIDSLTQFYVFVNGIAGVWVKWFRPQVKNTFRQRVELGKF